LDNVVLTRVAVALGNGLRNAVLEAVREETPARYRLVFVCDERPRTLLLSLDNSTPWIGRPARRGADRVRRGKAPPRPFAAACTRKLRGLVLAGLSKPSTNDRRVELSFADGQTLVAELSGPSPELVLLDRTRCVVARAGSGRASRERLAVGRPYVPRSAPPGRLDAFESSAAAIDAALATKERGSSLARAEALRKLLVGIGRETAELAVRESLLRGESAGLVIERRMAGILAGKLDPVIEGPLTPAGAGELGEIDAASAVLWPWEPDTTVEPPLRRLREVDPAATAGLYYEALERADEARRRAEGLGRILDSEIRRLRDVARRIDSDAERFADPEIWKRRGEALLAGLGAAKRSGDAVIVTDPYDPDGKPMAVPVEGGMSFADAAAACFRRYRRARRGRERVIVRAGQVAEQRARLERVVAAVPPTPSWDEIERMEQKMREAGIAVALEASLRAARAARPHRPRIEGARIFRSSDGWTVLVGKSGKDNARLTFKLSSPDDFWLHALGVAGAHVVIRNDERKPRPPKATLEEAAAMAAWFSESQKQSVVDVQWTRRKYVRKIRGAAPGTVRLKKFETVRIRPHLPADLDGGRPVT